MIYTEADKAIKAMNRENLKVFNRLKTRLMKADELHIIREVTDAYDTALRMAERELLRIAKLAYKRAMDETGKRKRNPIDRDWLLDYLEETEPVMLYRFIPEWERKKARLIEALAVAPNRGQEINKALKALTRQIGWFAISAVDAATVKAYKDAGVDEVRWNSEHDNRVCDHCWNMNGNIYRIDEIPPKPHPGCRCWLTPILPFK